MPYVSMRIVPPVLPPQPIAAAAELGVRALSVPPPEMVNPTCRMSIPARESPMSASIPKLKKGVKAFTFTKQGKFFHLQSALLSSPIYPQHAEAFKIAADMILDLHQSAGGGPHHDALVFPVLYLYRHCLELKLKDFVLLGVRTRFFALAAVQKTLGEHELCPLWTLVKKLIVDSYPDDNQAHVAESIINDFHQIDRDGQTLRYDRKKDTLRLRRYENLPSHISVVTLRNTMDGIYRYLDNCYAGILDWWDASQHAEGY